MTTTRQPSPDQPTRAIPTVPTGPESNDATQIIPRVLERGSAPAAHPSATDTAVIPAVPAGAVPAGAVAAGAVPVEGRAASVAVRPADFPAGPAGPVAPSARPQVVDDATAVIPAVVPVEPDVTPPSGDDTSVDQGERTRAYDT